jgi:hypothetical protein
MCVAAAEAVEYTNLCVTVNMYIALSSMMREAARVVDTCDATCRNTLLSWMSSQAKMVQMRWLKTDRLFCSF